MLEVGMKAPQFTLPDKNGNMVVRDKRVPLRLKIRKSKIKTRWLLVLVRIA